MSNIKIEKAQIVLEEMRRMFELVETNTRTLDEKSNNLLSNSSIILTLFGAIQLSIPEGEIPKIVTIGLMVLLILFVFLVIFLFKATKPRNYQTPFAADWEDIDSALHTYKSLEDTLDHVSSRYRNKIVYNEELNANKVKKYKCAYILYIVMIIIMVGLSINLI